MNDLEELAALNRQIAEQQRELDALRDMLGKIVLAWAVDSGAGITFQAVGEIMHEGDDPDSEQWRIIKQATTYHNDRTVRIAELRSVLSALLLSVGWKRSPHFCCAYCDIRAEWVPYPTTDPEYYSPDYWWIPHTKSCPYRRAKELASDADSPPSGSR